MKIGYLAKAIGCHVETVRYYEKEGLIPPAIKMANGYGDYSETHLKLLRLIRHAKSLGFSQQSVRELVELATNEGGACAEVHQLTNKQLDVVRHRLAGLRKMQKNLERLSTACEQNEQENCPVLEQLIQGIGDD